ncbi:MAG: RsmF rRNA methyltransferase first C-terminal domain-containing protein [Anaerolineales bacterium]|nr:RsmF rRNA methyltransferase first C-terminal domain-containing protein [Anaerolineales bacterium]
MINPIPPEFKNTIDQLLKNEASLFWDSFESNPPFFGLRLNPSKTSLDEIQKQIPENLTALPWCKDGFYIKEGSGLGKHPFHAAGLFYLQEPSAMVPAVILDPQPGENVLDLCAAPGGKTTQIQALMGNLGFLIANDSNPRRVQSLGLNVDRWGARNTAVICETPQRIFEHLGSYFDRVLVDAPCSGEGTFRSDPGEIKKWSPEFSKRCAIIQDEILWFAGKLVRPGGILVYSTCTFNQLENEGTIKRFLEKEPNFKLDQPPGITGFSPGIPFDKTDSIDIRNAVRIWPHRTTGEGHFIARLKKSGENPVRPIASIGEESNLDSEQKIIYQGFFHDSLNETEVTRDILPGNPGLRSYGNRLYWVPEDRPSLSGLRVYHWGWWLGNFQKDRFIPSPALAAGITRADAQKVLEFPLDDSDLTLYQRGSPIGYSGDENLVGHWALVCSAGYPLGWGKIQKGKIKSYFPSWLRLY